MTQKLEQALQDIFIERGYSLDDYHVDLFVLSDQNQLFIVCDHRSGRHIDIPVEDNVLCWPIDKIALVIAEGIDQANMQDKGYV